MIKHDITQQCTNSLYDERDFLKSEIRLVRTRLVNRAECMAQCETNNPTGLSIQTNSRLLTDLNLELVKLHNEFLYVSNEIIRRRHEDFAA